MLLRQPFVSETAKPAGNNRAHDKDDNGAYDLEAVRDEKINDRVLPLFYWCHDVFYLRDPIGCQFSTGFDGISFNRKPGQRQRITR